MFLRNKESKIQQNQTNQSIDCDLFSFTGVRFFQPKFISSLKQQSSPQQYPTKLYPQTKIQLLENQYQIKANKKCRLKQNIIQCFSKDSKKRTQDQPQEKSTQNKICKIRGLSNIGNTCYINSILQCLFNLNKFNTHFMMHLNQQKSLRNEVSLQYANIVQQFILFQKNQPFVPSKLKSLIGKNKNRFLGNQQQDAQQFLTAFLQIVNQEMSRIKQKPKYKQIQNNPKKKPIKVMSQQWWQYYKMRDDSVVCDYFQGQLISFASCKKCKNECVTFDNIWGLPLNLSKKKCHIEQLIGQYLSFQSQISDYYCNLCKDFRDCTKKVQLFRLPQILVIQLKRFDYSEYKKEKIKTSVKLSETLRLGQFLNKNAQSQRSTYQLNSIVHHYGQVDYGHYTATVYKQNQKKWYLLNDSKTSETFIYDTSNTSYLLFYVKT